MNTVSKEGVENLIPLLDRYMMAKFKLAEQIVKTGKIDPELAKEVSDSHDQLSIEWMKQKTETNEPRGKD